MADLTKTRIHIVKIHESNVECTQHSRYTQSRTKTHVQFIELRRRARGSHAPFLRMYFHVVFLFCCFFFAFDEQCQVIE